RAVCSPPPGPQPASLAGGARLRPGGEDARMAKASAAEPFSIRGFATRMRAVDAAACYPFGGDGACWVEGEPPLPFPPMDPTPRSPRARGGAGPALGRLQWRRGCDSRRRGWRSAEGDQEEGIPLGFRGREGQETAAHAPI
uniref:Uncharacterized protein n=1 Tax=Setaria italica TaxID=4555 RepID=K3XRK9_SETIT